MLSWVVNSRRHPHRSFSFHHCVKKPVARRDFRPFLSYTSALFHFPYPVTPLFATLTKTAGRTPTIPVLEPNPQTPLFANHFQLSTTHFMSFFFILLRTLLRFSALAQNSTLFFSCSSALFHKNTGGGVPPRSSRSKIKQAATNVSLTRSLPRRILPPVTSQESPVTSALVAALTAECYDLVFHDPC
jgi:hypothetical protein